MPLYPYVRTTAIFCMVLWLISSQVRAQVEGEYSAKLIHSYKSLVQQRIEALKAKTTPDYMNITYGAGSRTPSSSGRTLRIQATCEDTYLCKPLPLPVQLVSFTGLRLEPSLISLNWETTSERNNRGFEIERSSDAEQFEMAGFVPAPSGSSKNYSYRFQDPNASTDLTYYRLKQLDHDGSFTYSQIISLEPIKEKLSVVPAPNPGIQNNTYLNIKGLLNSASSIELAVYDLTGRLIYKKTDTPLTGNGQIPLAILPKLRAGLYVAKIITEKQVVTTSFIVKE